MFAVVVSRGDLQKGNNMENEIIDWYNDDTYYINKYFTKEKDMTQTRKFWMITGDGNSPKVRHANRQDAVREAERLAKSNPGIEFFVLEAVEMLTQPIGFVRQKL
jgi:hypothetical protein